MEHNLKVKQPKEQPKKSNLKFYLLVLVLLVVILILSLLFWHQPGNIYRSSHRFWLTHAHRTLNTNDIGTIRPWMTFDYINKVFKLPADYLKNNLSISNPHYPNISLSGYAEGKKISTAKFVLTVQEVVHNYLVPK